MSATATSNNATAESASSISEAEDMKMFQAARRTGRRNALGDLADQLAQGDELTACGQRFFLSENITLNTFFLVDSAASSSDVDKIAPRLQSMSIKH